MNNKDLEKYYDILEVDIDASEEEILNAYTYLKELYSSDSIALLTIEDDLDDEKKNEILMQIEEAYLTLTALLKGRETITIDLEEEEKEKEPEVKDSEEDSGYSTDLERRFANLLGMEDTIAEESVEVSIITGNDLKELREQMRMGIHELESITKIPYKTLVYIEKEKFDKLSDPGYLRWYVTQFAKALNIDPKETANQYMKRFRNWEKNKNK